MLRASSGSCPEAKLKDAVAPATVSAIGSERGEGRETDGSALTPAMRSPSNFSVMTAAGGKFRADY